MTKEKKEEETKEEEVELTPQQKKQLELRQAVRFFYDFQRLRIQSGNRTTQDRAALSEEHFKSLAIQSFLISNLEAEALRNIKRLLNDWPIYKWLEAQKGCGPTMSGALLAEIDITKAHTPSALWSYCGLAVKDGKAQRRTKGEKCGYNPWLKSKVVKVLADCMIKAKSPWRVFYDNYKTRKQNTMVPVCMLCEGKGIAYGDKCSNCKGTGGPAPWGKSDAHRHAASARYMIKCFLMEFWKEWRGIENLPICAPYAEAYLGRKHGDHGGSLQPIL